MHCSMSHHFTDVWGDVEKIIGEVFTDFPEKLDGLGHGANGVPNAQCTVHRLIKEKHGGKKKKSKQDSPASLGGINEPN